ncbi:hypothetical protein C0389_01520 [bacterium]|nr:hypothetical protein [bacterium]
MNTYHHNFYPIFCCLFILAIALQSCIENNILVPPVEESSIEMNVSFAPRAVKSTDGKVNILYSVEVSNFDKEGYKLKDFQVYNGASNTLLCNISDTNKFLLIHKPLQENLSDDFYYYAGVYHASYRFSVGLVLDPSQVPQKIKHSLVLVKNAKEEIIEIAETAVLQGQIPVISSPLNGERIISALTITLINNHHPTYQLTYKGKTFVPERFCADWNKINATGSASHGDQNVCENWYVYGQNVYAVADGFVVSVNDGMPDQSPVGSVSNDLNTYNSAGNSITIHIPGAGFAIYGHLKTNSILMKSGQMVQKGQIIGKVGNSGNSTAPHLHFGLHSDFPWYISEGLPFYIDSLEKIGSTGKPGGTFITLPNPEIHTNELVENCGVYNIK